MRNWISVVIAWLVIMTLVAPALVPSGMMLARDAGSEDVVITICSGFGSRQVIMNLVSGEIRDPRGTLTASGPDANNMPADAPNDRDFVQCPLCLINDTGDVAAIRSRCNDRRRRHLRTRHFRCSTARPRDPPSPKRTSCHRLNEIRPHLTV
ncbi:MAG: hypothetical protein U5O39_03555 [Gammaproteobacteria bacterium]|nr:hypothetical protein [Gammaproteobacteria bacterium]